MTSNPVSHIAQTNTTRKGLLIAIMMPLNSELIDSCSAKPRTTPVMPRPARTGVRSMPKTSRTAIAATIQTSTAMILDTSEAIMGVNLSPLTATFTSALLMKAIIIFATSTIMAAVITIARALGRWNPADIPSTTSVIVTASAVPDCISSPYMERRTQKRPS